MQDAAALYRVISNYHSKLENISPPLSVLLYMEEFEPDDEVKVEIRRLMKIIHKKDVEAGYSNPTEPEPEAWQRMGLSALPNKPKPYWIEPAQNRVPPGSLSMPQHSDSLRLQRRPIHASA